MKGTRHMALVPDEAIDDMASVSRTAFALYAYLCRCRNQKTGLCCPSQRLMAEETGSGYTHISRLKIELASAGWIEVAGTNIKLLKGEFPKTQPGSQKRKSGIPKNATVVPENATTVPENATRYKEQPANLTSKPNQKENPSPKREGASAPAVRTIHPAIEAIRRVTHRYPAKRLHPDIIAFLGEQFEECRLVECHTEWLRRGFNPMNYAWLFEWYQDGIPQKHLPAVPPAPTDFNGLGRFAQTRNTADNARVASEWAKKKGGVN